ncbi:MAG: hypothetical protein A2234_02435 [Elusimicrobia bacterium RIFOXYA2_FULL_58_8]|nr:MAG: hypothetical protein A2285_09225 [Elusimicrobia bacterium RIFOXYA12_FULL_57_11]OGS13167.1 MAG: hypothetical protein A2234_02435 [Elusimicrobia bacterium RIFOXYA2_FULL_58_8]
MKILGIHEGHLSTACLLEDGQILALASEERFNKKKNCGGFPGLTVEWLLKYTKTDPKDIDFVALSGLIEPTVEIAEPSVRRSLFFKFAKLLPARLAGAALWVKPYLAAFRPFRNFSGAQEFMAAAGIPAKKLRVTEHHQAHAASSYFSSGLGRGGEKTLVITLDGSGDGLGGTVSIAVDGRLERIASLPSFHAPGELYTRTTMHLGMRPWDHEYKVMGMAPYGQGPGGERAYEKFKGYLKLSDDGLRIINTASFGPALLDMINNDFKNIRFDYIAWGLQKRFEEVVLGFVKAWLKKTGLRRVCFGGGCFMNVKLNMLIDQLPEVDKSFFMPSGGDESLAFGAAYLTYMDENLRNGKAFAPIEPMKNLYLGPDYSEEEVLASLNAFKAQGLIEYEKVASVEEKTAELVAKDCIVALFSGRMEWGARALGNRSIIANASNPKNLNKLNKAIKMRDFWMPFAPSMLADRQHDYIDNPKKSEAKFMVLAFPSLPAASRDIISALHPMDLSCRPQLVDETTNPKYCKILKSYEKLTGMGAFLNTSFNLHGDPIVNTPEDAVRTLLNSQLDYVVMENYLVWRKK